MGEITEVKNPYVVVFYVAKVWESPEGDLERWRLIIEADEELHWVYTYNPALASLGTKKAEFYRDTSMRLCIRAKKERQ